MLLLKNYWWTLIRLFFLAFSLSSSATFSQIFSEVKTISGSPNANREAGGMKRSSKTSITTQYSAATDDGKHTNEPNQYSATKRKKDLTITSHDEATSTMLPETNESTEFTPTTADYLETTDSATTTKSSSTSESATSNSTSQPNLFRKDSSTMIVGLAAGLAACAGAVFLLLIALVIYVKRSKIKKRLLGSSGSSGMPRRTGAIRMRRSESSWKEKVNVGYSYHEMSATDLQLNDAGKYQPVYENCRSSADCAERRVQNERVQDKGNETKTNDTGSNELTEFRTYLELVVDDLDAWKQPVYENCWSSAGSAECGLENRVPGLSRSARTQSRKGAKHTPKSPSSVKEQDARKHQIYEDYSRSTDCAESGVQKYLEPVSLEQKEFSNCVEPNADIPKEPNPDYVNSGIHNVYESLDLSNLPPVYQELKHSITGAEGFDKYLDRGFLQQNDFRNCVEPIADFPKGPNPDYVDSEIYGDGPKNVYETLDLSDLPPVYQELTYSTTDK